MLIAQRDPVAWLALLANSAAIFLTCDIPLIIVLRFSDHLTSSASNPAFALAQNRAPSGPRPSLLLAMTVVNLLPLFRSGRFDAPATSTPSPNPAELVHDYWQTSFQLLMLGCTATAAVLKNATRERRRRVPPSIAAPAFALVPRTPRDSSLLFCFVALRIVLTHRRTRAPPGARSTCLRPLCRPRNSASTIRPARASSLHASLSSMHSRNRSKP